MSSSQQVTSSLSPVVLVLVRIVVICIICGLMLGLSVAADSPVIELLEPVTVVEMVAIIALGINLIVFIPAFALQTEKFYDLTGSLTYLTCTCYSLISGTRSVRAYVASGMVFVWAVRLGSFLFLRVMQAGKDDRFDEIKPNFLRFLIAWALQGLWIFLTAYPVFIINSDVTTAEFGTVQDIVGCAIWGLGFLIEVVSDRQKSYWRSLPENKGRFIEYGLWYYSRHPNYFGEVVLWIGMFIISTSSLQGTQWFAVISPVFVFCLIFFVSGVRLLEIKSDERFGESDDYQNYKETTSIFVILPKLGKRF